MNAWNNSRHWPTCYSSQQQAGIDHEAWEPEQRAPLLMGLLGLLIGLIPGAIIIARLFA